MKKILQYVRTVENQNRYEIAKRKDYNQKLESQVRSLNKGTQSAHKLTLADCEDEESQRMPKEETFYAHDSE